MLREDLATFDMPMMQVAISAVAAITRDVAPGYYERLVAVFLDGLRAPPRRRDADAGAAARRRAVHHGDELEDAAVTVVTEAPERIPAPLDDIGDAFQTLRDSGRRVTLGGCAWCWRCCSPPTTRCRPRPWASRAGAGGRSELGLPQSRAAPARRHRGATSMPAMGRACTRSRAGATASTSCAIAATGSRSREPGDLDAVRGAPPGGLRIRGRLQPLPDPRRLP